MTLENLLQGHSQLFVQQRREWIEIVIDWETTNKYAVLDANKNELALIAERGGDLFTKLRRWFLRSHRPLDVDVFSKTSEILLKLSRPFFWFFSDLNVADSAGQKFGSVHRRFGLIYKKYDLRDETGQVFARIASPIWRLWTFPVLELSGTPRAKIAKRWGGALREVFTDADTYLIDFETHPWSFSQRCVIFAAAVSIDFDFFENNQGPKGGLVDLFD